MIRLGTLLPGATPIGVGTTAPLKGFAWMSDATQESVVVKKVPVAALAAEVFCAALGRAAELPIPEPVIIKDQEADRFLFGSVYQAYPNLLQRFQFDSSTISDEQLKLVGARVMQWTKICDVIGFDEWINNVDRNLQNILWDGYDEFVLIDHGQTLGTAPSGVPDENKLIKLALHSLMPSSAAVDNLKTRVLNAALEFEPGFANEAAEALYSAPVFGASKACAGYLNFVAHRLPILANLLIGRFPTNQMNLELTNGR